jgi:uncharacterized protein YdeI (YjbR/CyaY-like superfamily)
MKITDTLRVVTRSDWRAWLEAHHERCTEIWLVLARKRTGLPTLTYDGAVEEALCFGWIDGLVKRIDEATYARRFTPRKAGSNWSVPNIRRVRALIRQGVMTPSGRRKIPPALLRGRLPASARASGTTIPAYVARSLRRDATAWRNFRALALSHRRNYIRWIMEAKKEETRRRRAAEAVALLRANRPPGLK